MASVLVDTHAEEGWRPATTNRVCIGPASQICQQQCCLVVGQRVDEVVELTAISVHALQRKDPSIPKPHPAVFPTHHMSAIVDTWSRS